MTQPTPLSRLIKQLETTLQGSTAKQGRVRYRAGQAFVDFSAACRESYPFDMTEQALRDATWDSEERLLAEDVRIETPTRALSALSACIREVLEDYIDGETDRIGHSFPIVGGSNGYIRSLANGLRTRSYETSVSKFAESLTRASLALGPVLVGHLVKVWKAGQALNVQTSAVLSGVRVAEDLMLPDGLAVHTLPSTSELLPLSVPRTNNLPVMDILGETVLTINSTISPPLFRPNSSVSRESQVELQAADRFQNVGALCESMALVSGQYVSPSGSGLITENCLCSVHEISVWSGAPETLLVNRGARFQSRLTPRLASSRCVIESRNDHCLPRTIYSEHGTFMLRWRSGR